MKFTGKLKEPVIDFRTGRTTAVIELYEDFKQTYEQLKDEDKISLEIKKYKIQRSLNANAYYWTLLTKLAKIIGLSNPVTIRKLTPKECFRLQGWTDDYFEKASFVNSDSQLYKQAGNGVTVNVVQEIGMKIKSLNK